MTRFYLRLSHLHEHNFNHNFQNWINPLKILSRANSLISNNNIRSVILEIKNDRRKIVKILKFVLIPENIFKVNNFFLNLKMFPGKRTKYQYFHDFTSVVFNFQYDASHIIIRNELILFVTVVWISSHFFLHSPLFDDKTITLLSTRSKIDCKLIETNESSSTETLLFDNSLFDLKKTPISLTNLLIIFYPLKDSKNPHSNLFE